MVMCIGGVILILVICVGVLYILVELDRRFIKKFIIPKLLEQQKRLEDMNKTLESLYKDIEEFEKEYKVIW